MDNFLLTELNKAYEDIFSYEQELSENEKKEKHLRLTETANIISKFAFLACKEGLLSLEMECEKMNSTPDTELLKKLIMNVVDGNESELIKRLGIMTLCSTKRDATLSIIYIMTIYGVLAIQAGENPYTTREMLNCMLPEDAKMNFESNESIDEVEEETIDFEDICHNDMKISADDNGYFEVYLCENTLLSLDNRATEMILKECMESQLISLLSVFSGAARTKVFRNISKNNAEKIAAIVAKKDHETWNIEGEIKEIKKAATLLLKSIHNMEEQGNLVFCGVNLLSNFLSLINNKDMSDDMCRSECDEYIQLLENFKKYVDE